MSDVYRFVPYPQMFLHYFRAYVPLKAPLLCGFEDIAGAVKLLVKIFARHIAFFKLVCYYTNGR